MSITFYDLNAQEYDINDPRNPNCPCHKMQQLADEEFATQNKQVKNGISNNIIENNTDAAEHTVDEVLREDHHFLVEEKTINSSRSTGNYKKKRKK